ncbi:MAG: twin-arginine translocase subunit TatC [Bacteroidetes bacterium]|jgi:sec-independent protein translocase protein TatC|nr:twin-arginine translocase subunit TatC [Bacteroidota bacterium]
MFEGKNDDMTFLEHLEELRWHLIRSLFAIVLVGIVAFVFKDVVFDTIILAPRQPGFFTNRTLCNIGDKLGFASLCINSSPVELKNIYMAGQFTTHILVSVIAGIVVASPYLFYEIYRFINPGLYKNEKKYAALAIFYCSFLFMLGVMFGYFLISPLSVHFLGSYQVSTEVSNEINLVSYITTVSSITLASAIVFELPVIIYFLSKMGLVTPEFLRKYRKHAFIVVLLLSAIITPPDILSLILVAMPLSILYEIGIRISKNVVKAEAV